MSEEWRLRVDLHEEGVAGKLTERLEASELEHDLKSSFHERVVVSRDGPEVFCYTATRAQAEAAERTIRTLADEHGWRLDCALARWHPDAEAWEPPASPLPATANEHAAERAELMEQEREESAHQGYPEFEVRVHCRSRSDAARLVQTLRSEGLRIVHRGEFVLLGATDEDSAEQLAERVRREAPDGSEVTAQASVPEVVGEAPGTTPFSPFAVFGGLGG